MSNVEKRYKTLVNFLILFSVISLLSFAGGWFYSLSFNRNVSEILTQAKFLNKEALNKTEISQKYKKVSDYESLVFDSLPSSKEVSSFVADVEAIANKNNIKITSSTVGTTAKSKQANLEMSQTVTQKDYYELPIKYSIEGSYQGYLQMLSDLSNLRRLNTVSAVDIIRSATESAGDKVTVNFVDTIYIKK